MQAFGGVLIYLSAETDLNLIIVIGLYKMFYYLILSQNVWSRFNILKSVLTKRRWYWSRTESL